MTTTGRLSLRWNEAFKARAQLSTEVATSCRYRIHVDDCHCCLSANITSLEAEGPVSKHDQDRQCTDHLQPFCLKKTSAWRSSLAFQTLFWYTQIGKMSVLEGGCFKNEGKSAVYFQQAITTPSRTRTEKEQTHEDVSSIMPSRNHFNVICDSCRTLGLNGGARNLCRTCDGQFDLCAKCYNRGDHDRKHDFYCYERTTSKPVHCPPRQQEETSSSQRGTSTQQT